MTVDADLGPVRFLRGHPAWRFYCPHHAARFNNGLISRREPHVVRATLSVTSRSLSFSGVAFLQAFESGQKRAWPCFDGRVVYLLTPLQERLNIAHAFTNHFWRIFG